MLDLKQLVLDKVNAIGTAEAAAFFGKKESVVKTWLKKGNIAGDSLQRALDDHLASEKAPDAQPTQTTAPVITPIEVLQQHETSLRQIVTYLNGVVIPFFTTEKKAFEEKFAVAEQQLARLTPPAIQNGTRTVAEVMASDSVGNAGTSLTRPGAQTLATFAEPVGGGQARIAHPLDSGIAPSAEAVRQQAQNPIENHQPGAPVRLAGPAVADPNAAGVGTPGWNRPYPPRR